MFKYLYPQTIKSLEAEIKSLKDDTKNFISLLAENTNISQKNWNNFMNDEGSLIKAKKAISLGIATDVL